MPRDAPDDTEPAEHSDATDEKPTDPPLPLRRRTVLKGTLASSIAAGGFPAITENVAAQQSSAQDWPQFQFDTANTGHNPDGTGPTSGVASQWDPFSTGGHVTSPVVVDGVIYAGCGDGNVYAVDAADGSQKWSFGTGGTVWAPAVVSGTVYIGSRDGHVYAVNADDGTQQWEWPFPKDGASGAPTVANGTVFAPGGDDRFFALDANDGSERWRVFTEECLGGQVQTPAVVDGVVYITEDCGKTWALNASDGTVQWKFNDGSGRGQGSPPTVADGTVYFGTLEADSDEGNKLFAVDAASGTEQWRFTFTPEGDVNSSPAVANGTVFFGSDNGNVYAVNASDGTEAWDEPFSTGGAVNASPAVVSGVVYIASDDGNLYLIDAATGDEIDRFSTGGEPGSSPAVANGNVYVGSLDGNLYGLEEGDGDGAENTPPTAVFDFTPDEPVVGQEVTFDPSASSDTDGTISTFGWDFDGDDNFDKTTFTDEKVTHTYSETGDFSVTLKVTDDDGAENTTRKDITVSEKAEVKIQENSVRLVQIVENTRVEEVGYNEPDPELISNRNVAPVFNLKAVKNREALPEEVTVYVTENPGQNDATLHPFILNKEDIIDIDDGEKSSLIVLNNTRDVPVFELDPSLDSVEFQILNTDQVKGNTVTLNRGDPGFSVALFQQALRIGFISVRDPGEGENYGFNPSEDTEDPRTSGGPIDYENTVENAIAYLRRVYPVEELAVYRHDDFILGSTDEPRDDYQTARCQLEDSLSDQNFPTDGEIIEGEASVIQDAGFDATVLIVPTADDSNQSYFEFHDETESDLLGEHQSGWASTAVIEGSSNTPYVTVAHELGHHFVNSPPDHDLYESTADPENQLADNHPLAQRDEDGAETTVDGSPVDFDHARSESDISDNINVTSTAFDLTNGNFTVIGDYSIDNDGYLIFEPLEDEDSANEMESFMGYGPRFGRMWCDSRIYQRLIDTSFENPDSGGERQSVLCTQGNLTSNQGVEFNHARTHRGVPQTDTEGNVSLKLLDPNENSLASRNVPDKIEFLDDRGDRTVEGSVMATLPFPEATAKVRAEYEGVVTDLNPIDRSVRDAIRAIPNDGFINRPHERSRSFSRKLDAINKQMEREAFRAAQRKMRNDVRDKITKWLKDDYATAANQPTKQELLSLVDDMIRRLGRLEDISN